MLNDQKKRVHCIGVGGIGVSALAEMLLARGYEVSGSDVSANANTERLARLGVKVSVGHRAENVAAADWVVFSSAISPKNPEYAAAQANNLPLFSRGKLLAELVYEYQVVSVAGTHGKTTTAGLIAHALMTAGCDPSYVIGGQLRNQPSPLRMGQGERCVVEVDESDASFLHMQSEYAVVTNIDADHLEAYRGSFDQLKRSFLNYLSSIPSTGAAVVCIDDPVVRELLPQIKCRCVTYGFDEEAQVRATDFHQDGMQSLFTVNFQVRGERFPVALSLPGRHNVLNALAALALGKEWGLPDAAMQQALAEFPGMGRRFHAHGSMPLAKGEALVFEDYGHHPKEIRATLEAAKLAWPDRRVVLVFQPHRYTRTRDLYEEFVSVLQLPDKLYLMDVYSAGEVPIAGFSSEALVQAIRERFPGADVAYVGELAVLPAALQQGLQDGDVVILQGAGSVGAVAKPLTAAGGG